MTIVYKDKKFPPPPFDQELADIDYYRKLYDGEHTEIFPRSRQTVTDTIIRRRRVGKRRWQEVSEKVSTSDIYVIVNFTPLIAEIPADLINRALGNISADTEEGPELEFVEGVVQASKIADSIWAAVVQHQTDGRVAYRVRRNESGKTWFEWILGDQYLPHDDGEGADITWIEEHGDEQNPKKYLRVERHRLESGGLTVRQKVFLMNGDNVGDEIDIGEYASEYGLYIPEDIEWPDVDELLCGLVTNDATLKKPRGRSALRDVDTIQEEINWTITRDAVVFDKHGKPKLAIPRKLWDTVANQNAQHYGGQRFVRNADLEVVSYDENNGAVPMYITWDARLEQSFKHVDRLIKYMLAITKTSPQAAGLEEATGQSGVALLYLWIQSVIKAEAIKEKFDTAIKDAIRKCMILENKLGGQQLEIKDPVIEWGDMMPKADSEKDSEETEKYTAGVQSLETTIRRMHPDWSEESIYAEIEKIQNEKAVDAMNPTFTQPPRVTLPTGDE